MKLAISGPGQAGKGTVSQYISDNWGIRYQQSTSEAAAAVVFRDITKQYSTVEECWADRANHREEWGQIIADFNQPDGIGLYRQMAGQNDIFDGIRRRAELQKCKEVGLVDKVVWLNRPNIPLDASLDYGDEEADYIVDNSTTIEDLYSRLNLLWAKLELTQGTERCKQ